METIIVAIPVDYGNARKACNLIENQVFESYGSLRTYLDKELDINEDNDSQPQFFELSDFMEECNDQRSHACSWWRMRLIYSATCYKRVLALVFITIYKI